MQQPRSSPSQRPRRAGGASACSQARVGLLCCGNCVACDAPPPGAAGALQARSQAQRRLAGPGTLPVARHRHGGAWDITPWPSTPILCGAGAWPQPARGRGCSKHPDVSLVPRALREGSSPSQPTCAATTDAPPTITRTATLSHAHDTSSSKEQQPLPPARQQQQRQAMALSPYFNDPFFGQLERAMDRAFDRALGSGTRSGDVMQLFTPTLVGPSGAGGHPMDIIESKDAFTLVTDTPGFTPEDVSVEMNDGTLTISGKRKEEKVEEKEGKVVRRERHLAQFTRAFTLPEHVDADAISASMDKGVLRVTVPKTEPAPKPEPKRIAITGA